jgi:hypothetical protein
MHSLGLEAIENLKEAATGPHAHYERFTKALEDIAATVMNEAS